MTRSTPDVADVQRITTASPPTERTLQARAAAHSRWARQDPKAGTAPARAAFLERFDNEVDPNRELPPDERARRAQHARKAYFAGLALKSAQARRRRREAAAVTARAGSETPGGRRVSDALRLEDSPDLTKGRKNRGRT
ncbi:MAG: hypothetical protein WD598_16360 [Acidimicrobiia bacterium]